jgi:ribosomal protein L9
LSDEIEQAQAEKKKQQRKMKRIKDKIKKKEVDLKKQEENEKQRFLSLPDTEKVRNICNVCHFVDDRRNIRYELSLSSLSSYFDR